IKTRKRDLANRAIQLAGICEVYGRDIADRLADDLVRSDIHFQPEARQDRQLGTCILAVNVETGIGFGKACCLGLDKSVRKRGVRLFDAAENVVASPVENAAYLNKAVARKTILQAGEHRYAPGNTCSETQVTFLAARKLQ